MGDTEDCLQNTLRFRLLANSSGSRTELATLVRPRYIFTGHNAHHETCKAMGQWSYVYPLWTPGPGPARSNAAAV